jgi:4-methylaminobutanoate oxidase (formaldehyde-forming)
MSPGAGSAFYLQRRTDQPWKPPRHDKGVRACERQVFEDTAVTGIKVKKAVWGRFRARRHRLRMVINCAGIWGGTSADGQCSVPLYAAEHMHAVTQPIKGLKRMFPCVRDFDGRTYFKAENGAILFGGFEAVAKPWGMKGIPKDFKFTELSEDWEQFSPFMECGLQRFPDLETAEIRHLSNVPESFTPDNAFMVGEAPGIKNFFVGCGMNSVGIASAAGCGRALAQWVDQGYREPLWPVDIRRYFH